MATPRDFETEGVTTFQSPPTTLYRYVLLLKDEKLSIWIEDKSSKKQWCKIDMVKGDFVASANLIIDASALDYIKCFQGSGSSDD
ncbi:hypothetical protein V7S43_013729 [Phytophthora oleae]|uniref:Uncharacterized protein n=1 Tax=Phytophthora oleae TaxID=2107226 RepID=A0ABD3F6N6_9STRA